ncbi:MAG: O-antigen ligase family protein [Bacteroides sp.]|nr:O-antigen ligase family protein [Bacteroides sp.]
MKIIFFLLLFSALFQSNNVIEIGSVGVGAFLTTSFAFILMSGLMKPKRHPDKKKAIGFILSYILFLLFVALCAFCLGIAGKNILSVVQLLVYVVCAYCLSRYRYVVTWDDYKACMKYTVVFLLCFSPIQYLATLGYIPRDLLTPLFFNEVDDVTVYFHHPEAYQRLLGTFKEPSFCAPFMVGAFFFIFHLRKEWKNASVLLSLLFVELVLTKSSTGYGAFGLMTVIYVLKYMGWKELRLVMLFSVLLGLFIWTTKDTLMREVVFEKAESNSAVFRMQQEEQSLEYFLQNIWIGIGLGQSRSSSVLITILAEFGIVGTLLFLFTLKKILLPLGKREGASQYEIASRLFVLSVLISLFIAIPDINYCVLWFSVYLSVLSDYTPLRIDKRHGEVVPVAKMVI